MRRIRFLTPLLLVAALGCFEKEPVPVHPVSGQVNYNGKPAKGVRVYLYPTSAPMVPDIPSNPHGVTGADGRFTLTTYAEGDGAAEGGYQVILLWPPETPEDEESDADKLLGWYSAIHSKLTAEIKAGDNKLPTFNLPAVTKPPQESQGIPGRN